MNLYVIYDKRGNIVSLVVLSAKSSKSLEIILEKGQNMIEAEGHSIESEEDIPQISEIADQFLVDLKSEPPKLVSRKTYRKSKSNSKKSSSRQ